MCLKLTCDGEECRLWKRNLECSFHHFNSSNLKYTQFGFPNNVTVDNQESVDDDICLI